MGLLHTPLTNTPVTDWTDTAIGPDVPQTMMNALGSLERYANVPVVDGPTRETLMPLANRYVGQVTYNAATDAFEYWTGTAWKTVNRKATLPSTVHVAASPNVNLNPGQYYDYTINVTFTESCLLTVFAKCWGYCVTTPTTWGGMAVDVALDDGFAGNLGVSNVYFSANTGGGQMDVNTHWRLIISPGVHKVGMRVRNYGGNSALLVQFVSFMGFQTHGVQNSAGPGAYGPF